MFDFSSQIKTKQMLKQTNSVTMSIYTVNLMWTFSWWNFYNLYDAKDLQTLSSFQQYKSSHL